LYSSLQNGGERKSSLCEIYLRSQYASFNEVLCLPEIMKARWLDVCAEAAICDRPERLRELTEAIVGILEEQQERLEKLRKNAGAHTAA
jgi:hypothetical protein